MPQTDVLGLEYWAMTYVMYACLGVVATQDGTTVRVTLPPTDSATINYKGTKYTSGRTISVVINR